MTNTINTNTKKFIGEWVATITKGKNDAIRVRDYVKEQIIKDIMENKKVTNGTFEITVWEEKNGVRNYIDFFSLSKFAQRRILEIYLYEWYVGGSFDEELEEKWAA